MAQFLAMTSRGLHDALQEELTALNIRILKKDPSGVWFEGNWQDCYRANLWLRTATRIVKPLLDFPAYQPEDLYHNTLKHDFTKYIEPSQTLAVEAHVRESSFSR